MEQKITLKSWLSNFFGGIRQVLCRVGRAFDPRDKTPFWRVVWAVITVCVAVVTAIVAYEFYRYHTRDVYRYADKRRISANMRYVKPLDVPGRIEHIHTGEVMGKDIDWIALSDDEDSLMVYSKGGKRGYINRFSGEVAIPARYARAWVFSGGVAAVSERGDSICFIDHSGRPINGRRYARNPKVRAYVYHGDYCAIATPDGRMGLVDRSGDWAVEPVYDWICAEVRHYWRMRRGDSVTGLWYAFDDSARQVTCEGYPGLAIDEEAGIIATCADHSMVAYGWDGVKSDAFLFGEMEDLCYATDRWDAEGNREMAAATLKRYRMPDGYEGLCTADGRIVTAPIFWEVSPVSRDLYHCRYKDAGVGVLVNTEGEIVNTAG